MFFELLSYTDAAVLCVGVQPPAGLGAVHLPSPVSAAVLLQTLAFALEMRARLHALEGENERLISTLRAVLVEN